MSDKYAVITAHRTEFPVHLMCRILAVSRAGYDDAKGRALSARTTADVSPAATITDTFTRCLMAATARLACRRPCAPPGITWAASAWRA